MPPVTTNAPIPPPQLHSPLLPQMITITIVLLLGTHQSLVTSTTTIISGTSTLTSPNHTFSLGFFSPTGTSTLYLATWYSIPLPTYVWVANRLFPVLLPPATLSLTPSGRLALLDASNATLWSTSNPGPAAEARLLDNGNLVLLDNATNVVWQSFDSPADTWLPEMPLSRLQLLTSWRSPSDPAPGPYHLRLRPPDYGAFELVYWNLSATTHPVPYWSTGSWLGDRFAGVPEMTVPYIYDFNFSKPFTAVASFAYTLKPAASAREPLLTRFVVDPSGQLQQYTWSAQTSSWNMFWSRPEDLCGVHRLCGNLGFCGRGSWVRPCQCLTGFRPSDPLAWSSGDFSGGCTVDGDHPCVEVDNFEFMEIGPVELDVEMWEAYPDVGREACDDLCRGNCSCVGIGYDSSSRTCRTMFGTVLNLSNSTAAMSTTAQRQDIYLKVTASSSPPPQQANNRWQMIVIASGIVGGFLAATGVATLLVTLLCNPRRRRRKRKKKKKQKGVGGEAEAEQEEEASLAGATANLQVFTYKELSTATKGFTDEIGHGGFGAVFRGELADSAQVAVKRLDRPGGGDREFRAEVRTIGGIQHVNLVRLRGFCSEGPHRLLVYEYMPGGPLSAYLRRRGGCQRGPLPLLPWRVRFGVAVGTARGIAYLHEECRDCIIHCDIKPENILLDSGLAPKISDFGLAKLVGRDFSRVLTTMRGTWGYVAPEWISGLAITAKADVYSYGMTLLEILAGRRNVDAPPGEGGGGEEEGGWFLPPWAAREVVAGNVGAVVDPALGEEYERGEAERAGRVAVWCIQDQEAARPSMGMVVKMLEGTVEAGVPPLPGLLQSLVAGDSFPKEGIPSVGVSPSTASTASEERISAAAGATAVMDVSGRSAYPR